MECSLRCELIPDCLTDSIFVKTEKKLNSSDYQESLEFVGRLKNMGKYRSMMDFLFCESFPAWRFHAFRFYNGRGPQLKDTPGFTKQKQNMYDVLLCDGVLELCFDVLKNKRWVSWGKMLHSFDYFLKAA